MIIFVSIAVLIQFFFLLRNNNVYALYSRCTPATFNCIWRWEGWDITWRWSFCFCHWSFKMHSKGITWYPHVPHPHEESQYDNDSAMIVNKACEAFLSLFFLPPCVVIAVWKNGWKTTVKGSRQQCDVWMGSVPAFEASLIVGDSNISYFHLY